jgi:hypothetical protein
MFNCVGCILIISIVQTYFASPLFQNLVVNLQSLSKVFLAFCYIE